MATSELFTGSSLLSLQGSAAAALLVPNVLNRLNPVSSRTRELVALLIAIALSYVAAAVADGGGALKWAVAFFNGLLVFAAALGVNEAAASGGRTEPPSSEPRLRGRRPESRAQWFASWLRD